MSDLAESVGKVTVCFTKRSNNNLRNFKKIKSQQSKITFFQIVSLFTTSGLSLSQVSFLQSTPCRLSPFTVLGGGGGGAAGGGGGGAGAEVTTGTNGGP